jgi:hypothetical protein
VNYRIKSVIKFVAKVVLLAGDESKEREKPGR